MNTETFLIGGSHHLEKRRDRPSDTGAITLEIISRTCEFFTN